MEQHFGIIGYPLSHSFSPTYFNKKFLDLKLTKHSYNPYPINNISEITNIINNPYLKGLNVTIPYKEAILPYLHHANQAVHQIGACNCISILNNKLYGHNTDVIGFEASLLPLLKPHHTNALILGTGGAAKAVNYVLQKNKIETKYVSRTPNQTSLSYEAINKQTLQENTLIINTTPLGMLPNIQAYPPIKYEYLNEKHLCYDLIYNPAETKFLSLAKQKNASIKNGYEMLILQAEASWDIWQQNTQI